MIRLFLSVNSNRSATTLVTFMAIWRFLENFWNAYHLIWLISFVSKSKIGGFDEAIFLQLKNTDGKVGPSFYQIEPPSEYKGDGRGVIYHLLIF